MQIQALPNVGTTQSYCRVRRYPVGKWVKAPFTSIIASEDGLNAVSAVWSTDAGILDSLSDSISPASLVDLVFEGLVAVGLACTYSLISDDEAKMGRWRTGVIGLPTQICDLMVEVSHSQGEGYESTE